MFTIELRNRHAFEALRLSVTFQESIRSCQNLLLRILMCASLILFALSTLSLPLELQSCSARMTDEAVATHLNIVAGVGFSSLFPTCRDGSLYCTIGTGFFKHICTFAKRPSPSVPLQSHVRHLQNSTQGPHLLRSVVLPTLLSSLLLLLRQSLLLRGLLGSNSLSTIVLTHWLQYGLLLLRFDDCD